MRWAVLDPAPHDTKGQLNMNIVSEFIIGGMSYVKAETRYSTHLHVCHLTLTFSLPPTSPVLLRKPGTWHTHLCQQRAAESGNWRWGIYLWPVWRGQVAFLQWGGSWNTNTEQRASGDAQLAYGSPAFLTQRLRLHLFMFKAQGLALCNWLEDILNELINIIANVY